MLLLSLLWAQPGCIHARAGEASWEPPAYWAQERYLQLAGLRICYLEAGPTQTPEPEAAPAETILFIHGWSGNVQNWWAQFEHFARDHRVIVFDAPGHGRSERGDHLDYSADQHLEVALALLDTLEVERAVVVGNSGGGRLAATLAIRYPQRVSALVLADSTGTRYLGKAGPILHTINPGWLQVANMTTGDHYPGLDSMSRARQDFVHSFAGTVEELPYLEALAALLALDYVRIPDRDLARIQVPTLIVWGDDDPVLPRRAMRALERAIPDSQGYLVHLGTHSPMMASPDEFNCAMRSFLAGTPTDPCSRYALTKEIKRERLAGGEWGPRYP